MIKIVDDIKHVAISLPGTSTAGAIHFVYTMGMTLVIVQEGLLTRPLDGQQASIHIEAGVGFGEYALKACTWKNTPFVDSNWRVPN